MTRLEQDFYYILFGGQKIFWDWNLLLKFWIEILSLAIGSLEVRMLFVTRNTQRLHPGTYKSF